MITKKNFRLILPMVIGTFLFSCSKDTMDKDSNILQNNVSSYEPDYKEPFIAYNTQAGPMGMEADGPGSYPDPFDPSKPNDRWKNFREGGNCVVPSSVCIMTWPRGGNLNKPPYTYPCTTCDDISKDDPSGPPIDLDRLKHVEKLKKDYLDGLLVDLKTNLTSSELHDFSQSMAFSKEDEFVSWDMQLLEKGTAKNFEKVIRQLSYDLVKDNRKIILIEPSTGKERIIK